jgi:hypothetical protein
MMILEKKLEVGRSGIRDGREVDGNVRDKTLGLKSFGYPRRIASG